MKRDLLLIGTISVIIIAFTLSLLNIYVFPNIFYQTDIYRNTSSQNQLEMLYVAENLDLNATLFEIFNQTIFIGEFPQRKIVNITVMIENMAAKISAAFDSDGTLSPRRMRLEYNGTIVGAFNESTKYEDWIENVFDDGNLGTYFAFHNSSDEYEVFTAFSSMGVPNYNLSSVIGNLTEIFENPNRRPDFVIYQTVYYFESRGFLNEYSIEFERIIFINSFGDIKLFLSNEGQWEEPLLF
ncbi:MAG: hypothetical protein HGN29_08995 [Asgard group archaeon]|nr:hypothetical protein [Asgard group archaeon]